MRKLRIGVWIMNDYVPETGGVYSYYSEILKGLKNYDFKDAEIIFIGFNPDVNNFPYENKYSITSIKPGNHSLYKKVSSRLKRMQAIRDILKLEKKERKANDKLKTELSKVIDVIYYPTQTVVIDNFPFIYTLWDLGHVSSYAFPELSMNGEFYTRKKHNDSIPHRALKVFSESVTGKEEIIRYLGIDEKRIAVVPIFPSNIISASVKIIEPALMKGENFFIHYPAQYWPHKNHYNLLIAFKKVLVVNPSLKLVLTGADKGNKAYVLRIKEQLGLSRNVIDLGFVSIEELKWLYLNSQGLVMPSFLGPTNIPLLEAAELSCRVACSDLKGHREQLGEYAYYFEPQKADTITTAIINMVNDNQSKTVRQYKRSFSIEAALKAIDCTFSELKSIRYCWGSFDEIH